ncbi:hypothetical protein A4G99_15235 [Haladaptatus sp. R4]|uniref:hypothetical protein n=1 Tax=Haladaptatus sp. R4 TaxID=1679489 RepID=UPI0007B4E398|nr:hypothetical protein [Haladaptatus sp. R4]KZN23366.1 hypothetical protein A4G99_15235 [Haladaptatus sp. R4]
MSTRRRQRFVHGQIAWMLVSLLGLAVLHALSLELFFVLSLIGLLVIIEFTAPFNVTPTWRRRLKWFILVGLAIFVVILARHVLAVLPSGVF